MRGGRSVGDPDIWGPTRWSRTALILGAVWIARYWASFGLHLWSPSRWHDWFDQGKYLRSAVAFAGGDLAAAEHWYSLAYPLLGAPFVHLTPGDPFFVPNLLLFLLACASFARAVGHLGVGPTAATVVFVLATLAVDSTAALWLIPWNTTLSAALTWSLIAQVASVTQTDASRRRWLVLGLTAGALPLVRPTEMLTIAGPLLVAAGLMLRRARLRAGDVLAAVAGGLAVALPYLLLHLVIYGAAPSRYMVEAARQGFAFADLPWKTYVLVITPQPWYPEAESLVERLPWLVPGAAGLLVLSASARGPTRTTLVVIAAAAIPYSLLFLAYTDLQPSGLWRFNNAHYFKWLFPLFGAGAWVWLREVVNRQGRAMAIAGLLLAIAPACLRIVPVAAADDVPARLLLFRGRVGRDWNEAYFASATVTDSRGRLENVRQFHQLPDAAGERAIAIVRPFAAHPRRDDPGEAARYATNELPYARYREQLSIGIPCWFDRAGCTLRR